MKYDTMFFIGGKGIYKQWIYGGKTNYNLSCDYIQKLNYDYEDYVIFNNPENIKGRKDVYYLVLLAVWIKDTCESLEKIIRSELLDDFHFLREEELLRAKKYIEAIRSALLAHPLNTDRHKSFGFDGDFISIDIGYPRVQLIFKILNNRRCSAIYLDGVHDDADITDCDYCIVGYRKQKGAEFYEHIGFNKRDIDFCVELYREKIQKLDMHLCKKKKRNYVE